MNECKGSNYLKSEDSGYFEEKEGWSWYWDAAHEKAHGAVANVLFLEAGGGYTPAPLTIIH